MKRQVDSNSRVGVQPPRTVTHPTRLGIQTPRMIPQSPRVVSPEVDVSPRVAAQQRDIERRSQLLSRIPSPPPLTPLPGPSPAVKRGFKTPFAIGRGGRAGDGASSLRKRLRDELEEECESPSKLRCVHHGEVGKDNDSGSRVPGKSKDDAQTCEAQDDCADMDLGGPKQHSSLKDMAQDSNGDEKLVCPNPVDHSQEVNRCRGVKEENYENFDDLLGLSASGIRELEMSWSQSQTTDEASTQASAMTGQRTVHEMVDSERFGCDTAEEDQYNDKELLTDDAVNDVRVEAIGQIADDAATITDPAAILEDITFEQGDGDLLNHTPVLVASTRNIVCSVINQKGHRVESDELAEKRLEAGEVCHIWTKVQH